MLIDAGTNESTNTLIRDIKGLASPVLILSSLLIHTKTTSAYGCGHQSFDIGTVYMPDVTAILSPFPIFKGDQQ